MFDKAFAEENFKRHQVPYNGSFLSCIKIPSKTNETKGTIIGINLKGQEPKGKLDAEKPNAMCSHKINIAGINDVDKEVIDWVKTAYDNAG